MENLEKPIEKKEIEDKKTEKIIEERRKKIKERVQNWLKDPINLCLTLVIIFAFIVRLYFFILVKNQPLWWDEACYGSLAKNLVYHTWDNTSLIIGETLIRPPLFPILWSILIRLGISESGNRFLLEFVPSILSVFFVYLIGKELYGKKVGLISSFIFSVLWIHLFYTLRFLTHIPDLFFLFSSIYLFIKSTKVDFNFKYFSISLFLLGMSTLLRYTNGLVFFVYLIILILNKNIFLIKKLKFWVSGIIGLSPILFFFLFNLITKGNIFPALFGAGYVKRAGRDLATIFFYILNYTPIYLKTTFFIFFILGTAIAIFEILIGYNFIAKSKKLKNHIFIILLLLLFYSFFIFYLRDFAEDRWLFSTSLPLACLSALGINQLYLFIEKYNKYFAIILIFFILFLGAYTQIKFADNLIKVKKESFLQIRQGFEWLRDNSLENSIILGSGIDPYSIYYSNKKYELFPENKSDVDNIYADYLVVHSFPAGAPDYINEYLQENQDKWQPINAFFFDPKKTQPALIIYKKY